MKRYILAVVGLALAGAHGEDGLGRHGLNHLLRARMTKPISMTMPWQRQANARRINATVSGRAARAG